MRYVILALAMSTIPAAAQSADAYGAYRECVTAKASEFAKLDGTLSELAAAAMGACSDARYVTKTAYIEYYEEMGNAYVVALQHADGTTSDLDKQLSSEALATVAQARLSAN